jgi:hypothetical protein
MRAESCGGLVISAEPRRHALSEADASPSLGPAGQFPYLRRAAGTTRWPERVPCDTGATSAALPKQPASATVRELPGGYGRSIWKTGHGCGRMRIAFANHAGKPRQAGWCRRGWAAIWAGRVNAPVSGPSWACTSPERSPRPITRHSCGTWHRASGARTSWPAWPRCRRVRVPRRMSGMPGRRCSAVCSAGWPCGDADAVGAGHGRGRAGGRGSHRLGAAPGLAPVRPGRIRDRPAD